MSGTITSFYFARILKIYRPRISHKIALHRKPESESLPLKMASIPREWSICARTYYTKCPHTYMNSKIEDIYIHIYRVFVWKFHVRWRKVRVRLEASKRWKKRSVFRFPSGNRDTFVSNTFFLKLVLFQKIHREVFRGTPCTNRWDIGKCDSTIKS